MQQLKNINSLFDTWGKLNQKQRKLVMTYCFSNQAKAVKQLQKVNGINQVDIVKFKESLKKIKLKKPKGFSYFQ